MSEFKGLFWFVLLCITSQNSAFGGPCNWNTINKNQSIIIFPGCESSKIDPAFLSHTSQALPNLTHLVITTSLTVIEEKQFVKASNLQTLDLSANKIHDVHETAFIGLHNLTLLKLNGNKIQSLPKDVFADLPTLNKLGLESNELTSFDFSIVEQNLQLKELRISQNAITHVWTSKQYSSILQQLSMQDNFLTSLAIDDLPRCLNLQTLNIYHNKLTEFDFENVKDKLPKLTDLNFRLNRFDCCFLVNMVSEMLVHMPNLTVNYDFVKYSNDTEALQRRNFCRKCGRLYENQNRLDELEAIIGRLEAKNDTSFTLYIIGLAVSSGTAFVIVVLISVGSLYFCCNKQPTKPQSEVKTVETFDTYDTVKTVDSDEVYGEILHINQKSKPIIQDSNYDTLFVKQ